MKKILIIIISLIIIIGIYKITKVEVVGDVNADRVVNQIDLDMVQQHLLNVKKLNKNEEKRADTNKDGKIDIVDLANIQKIILEVK